METWQESLFSFAEYPVAWPTPPPFFALRSSPERATKDGKQLRRLDCGELHFGLFG